jgi:hypothetical protein
MVVPFLTLTVSDTTTTPAKAQRQALDVSRRCALSSSFNRDELARITVTG